jgi:hypothetical protein
VKCVDCRKPATHGKRCEKHREANRAAARRRYRPSPNGPGRRPGAYAQTERVLRMLEVLTGGGRTPAELARYFEVTERQVLRDIAAIESAGFEVCQAGPLRWMPRRPRLLDCRAHAATSETPAGGEKCQVGR